MKSIRDLTENERIHAPTREIAEKLCHKFDELGLKWSDNTSYIDNNCWNGCEEDTVYHPANGTYGGIGYQKGCNFKIYTIDQLADFQILEINKDFLEELYGYSSSEVRTRFEKLYPDLFGVNVSLDHAKKIVAEKYGTNPENITIN